MTDGNGAAVTLPVIQVGVTSMRDENGEFLPPVKLYVEATEKAERSRERMLEDFARVFAPAMAEYMRMLPGVDD